VAKTQEQNDITIVTSQWWHRDDIISEVIGMASLNCCIFRNTNNME